VEQGWPQIDFASHFTESRLLVLETAGPDSVTIVAGQYERLLLEPSILPAIGLDSLQWEIQSIEGPVGPYEIWTRR